VPTALFSVFDKSGVAEFASELHRLGWRIVSSGGTAREIAANGVAVTDVADLTGVPAILGHRVVTLHPRVHGGLLADPTDAEHVADMEAHGIEPIDLVVVNLYPFSSDPGIELIDIGGPAMVRAAAKNHAHVAVVVNPVDYAPVLDEITANGSVGEATRRRLARDAFSTTAAYDAAIVRWLDETGADDDPLPRTVHLSLERAEVLRYGENPHQIGARYRDTTSSGGWWDAAVQHQGKALSYLNLYDTESASRLVYGFDRPAVVIVKHANPCGVAVADDIAEAYSRANACDPVSAFGGIVAANRPVTAAMAEALAPVFTEVVVAPVVRAAALEVLSSKPNLRVLTAPAPGEWRFDLRPIGGGLLMAGGDGR
jgi:phosphoribosylaminoimidazolecarboxamide formyltransferase/IMP cyclohydrolase